MSNKPGSDEIVFTGQGRDTGVNFISAVNRAAWRAGKLDDPKWTAQFAYSCFAKNALIWYEGLNDRVQQNWKELRAAILMEYAPNGTAGPADGPDNSHSGPNQGEWNGKSHALGRIRIKFTTAGQGVYLAAKPYADTWGTVSDTVDGAAVVEWDPSLKTIKWVGTNEYLMLGSYKQESDLFSDPAKLSKAEFHETQKKSSWQGPIQSAVWTSESKNRIEPRWASDSGGDLPSLQTVVFYDNKDGPRIYVVPDPFAIADILKSTPGTCKHARLYFEPIQL
ncbi:hypothetical protein FRB90_004708 [Tulasnella sp. 427]|nr:hypothetical protein FRB90_004708 [Tulasnella sp. 427]